MDGGVISTKIKRRAGNQVQLQEETSSQDPPTLSPRSRWGPGKLLGPSGARAPPNALINMQQGRRKFHDPK
ncbi:Hypothetical protein NTJ_09884 [Nesidiocoris tenuis]|uniref:BAT2 N-terminal domain-containing protein n=1 Tax=Nesidiocoris tenuis TaxID=355587 RepID=A0ABN7AY09_9HEMI|nr:Hypothetical protein NTJ_09884 [Nesidiocoris tenuis]